MQEITGLACRTHIDIFNARIVGTAFIHDDFARKPVSVDCLFEEGGGSAAGSVAKFFRSRDNL